MDQSDVQMWLETFFKSQEPVWVVARGGVLGLLAAALSLFTWMTGKVGWWGLKLTGRGARACWPGRRSDPQSAELAQVLLASLEQEGVKDRQLQKIVFLKGGCVDLAEQKVFLGLEDLRPLLTRGQHRQILKAARRVYDRLSRQEVWARKEKLLATLRPQPMEGRPATLQELHAQQTRDDEIHSLFVNVFGENGS